MLKINPSLRISWASCRVQLFCKGNVPSFRGWSSLGSLSEISEPWFWLSFSALPRFYYPGGECQSVWVQMWVEKRATSQQSEMTVLATLPKPSLGWKKKKLQSTSNGQPYLYSMCPTQGWVLVHFTVPAIAKTQWFGIKNIHRSWMECGPTNMEC